MEREQQIKLAASMLDAALETFLKPDGSMDEEGVYLALCAASRVPPGRGTFWQSEGTLQKLRDRIGELKRTVDEQRERFENGVEAAQFLSSQLGLGIPRIPRLPWDAFFMLHAHLMATRSTCDRGPMLLLDPGRRGVGAVLVRDRRIIAGGYNGSPPGQPHCGEFECPECEREWTEADFLSEGLAPERDCAEGEIAYPDCQTTLRGGHMMRDGHCVRTIHAEANALLQCALDETSPAGATVYTTASPCWDCSKLLVRAGVKRLVYGAEYGSRYGLSKDAYGLLRSGDVRVEYLDVGEALL